MNQQVWIWLGVCLGAGAGILGAYAGWRKACRPGTGPTPLWVAATTLGLAAGLGAVILQVTRDPARLLLLSLPVVFLGLWFAWQLKAIQAARGRKPRHQRARRNRK